MSIIIRNVSKSFGDVAALDQVSLEVPGGMLVALLGPSGSGKTTLLRIIAGLEVADSGTVLHQDEDITHQSARDRNVGFVFQHYALFRHMTVFENIAFGLRVRTRKLRPSRIAIREKVCELLRLIQLEGIENRYPSQLSGGQRQRVALARALAIEPKVLLLDEPFGALDAKVRQELRRWLRRLHDEIHVTSVFVTHDQEEALEVADRIVVMNKGCIEQVGTPDEVFHQPASEFVMDFLGSVNLFHGRVEAGKPVLGAPAADKLETTASRLFVRPYDLELDLQSTGVSSLPARVERVQSAGPQVKIELRNPSGDLIQVVLSHEQYRAKPVHAGDAVFVSPKEVKFFLGGGEGI